MRQLEFRKHLHPTRTINGRKIRIETVFRNLIRKAVLRKLKLAK